MRRLLGVLVLTGGVVGLGYVALTGAAPRIQSALAVEAQAVADTAPFGVKAQVSGRDVTVTGRVRDQDAGDALLARFEGIQGVRAVDFTAVQILPAADPYVLSAAVDIDGTRRLSGVIPGDASRALLADVMSVDLAAGLTLATGAPDDDFVDVAVSGILALDELARGDMVLSGTDLMLTGLAANPAALDRFNAALDSLPPAYTLDVAVDVRDDGTPLRLDLTLTETGVSASGKFPQAFPAAEITDRFGQVDPLDIAQAAVPAMDPRWPNMARISLESMGELITGQLAIDDTTVTLTGQGSPAGIARARALMAGLPDSFDVTTDLSLWDDGVPMILTVDWDGSTARASGKYPAGFTPLGPNGTAIVDSGQNGFLPDTDGAFTANANAGAAALALLRNGRLTSSATDVSLTGTATSPQVGVAIATRLVQAATGATIEQSLTYLDDGTPAAFTLAFDATAGATLDGRLPTTLTKTQIGDALGLAPTGSPTPAFEDANAGTSLDTLAIAATYLPEVETLTYARTADGSALDLILQPGVDVDLVATDLAERLPADVAFTISTLDVLPDNGTRRTNAATNQREVFNEGFWLPAVNFEPSVADCQAASDAVLAGAKITFLSGSALLDATSIRAINGLAAVVLPCVEAGLALEIGGHTDASGDAALNEVLSNNRATAVRIALIERGISDRTLASRGYGQTRPIADNATPEGRAANRRTTFTWTQP